MVNMDRDTELALIARAQTGDRKASEELIRAHHGIAVLAARRFRRTGVPFEDLLACARWGILDAIRSFDPGKGARLCTYCRKRARARISDCIRDHATSGMVGLDREWSRRHALAIKVMDSDQVGGDAAAELAHRLQCSRATAEGHLALMRPEYIKQTIVVEGNFDKLEQDQLRGRLQEAIARLTSREQAVLKRHRLSEEPEALDAIGLSLGLSGERVRQIEKRAIEKLRRRVQMWDKVGYMGARDK